MSIEVVEPIWQLVDIDTSISDETHQLSVSWPRIDGAGCIFFFNRNRTRLLCA